MGRKNLPVGVSFINFKKQTNEGRLMEIYSMNKKELNQVEVLSKVESGAITLKKAAELCNVSYRQIKRKYKAYITYGPKGLIHKARGKPSNRKLSQRIIDSILNLIQTIYFGFGPTLLAEKLEENHQIKVNHETVRRIMIKEGLFKPRKKKSVQRTWRDPKHHEGEMVQLDGSEHIWLGDSYSTLILFIDDATKKVYARFQPESVIGVTTVFREFITKHGLPRKIYCDRGKVFKVNNSKNKDAETQFSRMCKELDIEINYAGSAQAKGRVERVFRTLQDRLVKELKLQNINNTEDANKMLESFLEKFNSRFSIPAKNKEKLYRSIENYDLNSILCYKFKRKLNNDYTISFKTRWFQIGKKQKLILYAKEAIDVYESFDGTISLWKKGIKLNCFEIEKKIMNPKNKPIDEYKIDKRTLGNKPKKGHPWIRNSYEIEMNKRDISKK